jgi:hypothetical protein
MLLLYSVLSSFLSLHLSSVPMITSTPCSQTPSVYIPHCQLIGLVRRSSHLRRMYTFLFVKTNYSHVILTNAFPYLEVISRRNYSDRIDPSGPDLTVIESVFCSDFRLQTTQKNSKLRDILAYFKSD